MGLCWKCGKKESTQHVWGYPVCSDHTEEDIDPEVMEFVVLESFRMGDGIIPLDEILRRRGE